MNAEQKRELTGSLAWGLGILVLAVLGTLARKSGHIDGETVTRVVICANGLMIAWWGNRMPKAFVPSANARRVRRMAGWSLCVSGLIYAALWAFAPMQVAVWGGTLAIAAGIAVTVGYCRSLRAQTPGKA